jgi:hypothetical protein
MITTMHNINENNKSCFSFLSLLLDCVQVCKFICTNEHVWMLIT